MLNKIKILYVEDEKSIRENTKRPLEYLCDELIVAEDGEQGLELYKEHNPDIIVTDIKMPKLTGIDMCKLIKEINKEQYIIFTSAHSECNYFIDAIDMQVDGYILKPIDYDLLEAKIEKIISQIHIQYEYIEQKKEIEQQKINILEQSKLASMGEMIGNIAHQWRQPLSVISTTATGIQMQQEFGLLNNEKLDKLCETINNNAQYLSKTIDDFTNFIKGNRQKDVFNLSECINSFLHLVEGTIAKENINIVLNLDENININGYQDELAQCFINIFNNAKDIFIEKDIKRKIIFINTTIKSNQVIIEIKDNAGGIPMDIIEKIFEPYFTTKHQSQGTGLGLHMTYRLIIDGMNGTIEASNIEYNHENEEYNGAKFKIILEV